MDIQHQKGRDKDEEKQHEQKSSEEGQQSEQQPTTPPPPSTSAASAPSPSSSPSHDFSFTVPLHQSVTSTSPADKTEASPPSSAVDLSPAGEIFFHGHLLPLHLLSHLPVSPRSSTNSLDSFTLPIKEVLDDQPNNSSCAINNDKSDDDNNYYNQNEEYETKGRAKSRSFSLFGRSKWRKENDAREKEDRERQKRRLKFDVSHVLKRYMRMVRPFLSFRSRREDVQFHRQAYSFSGNLSFRRKPDIGGRRGEFSAPASMRTSPTNSGLLVATGTLSNSASDSTMEELQAAIQAAIAHCKNSFAMEEKIKCP